MSVSRRFATNTCVSTSVRSGTHGQYVPIVSHAEQGHIARALSGHCASTSSNRLARSAECSWGKSPLSRSTWNQQRRGVAVRALFEPPPFQPSKLSITWASGTSTVAPAPPESRRYTLTHNDITGELWLTVGADYNDAQISGFYTRLLRDEVTAEWQTEDGADGPNLHIFCHVSGEEKWLAPPILRNYIFRREMPLVLDCVLYAEQALLKLKPQLTDAKVYIHFESALESLNSIECWGILGDRRTWKAVPTSIMKRILYAILRRPLDVHGTEQADGLHMMHAPHVNHPERDASLASQPEAAVFKLMPVVAALDVVAAEEAAAAPQVEVEQHGQVWGQQQRQQEQQQVEGHDQQRADQVERHGQPCISNGNGNGNGHASATSQGGSGDGSSSSSMQEQGRAEQPQLSINGSSAQEGIEGSGGSTAPGGQWGMQAELVSSRQ